MVAQLLTVNHYMESPQHFIELFLRERTRIDEAIEQMGDRLYTPFNDRFYAVEYRKFCEERRTRIIPEAVLSVEETEGEAKVVTNGPAEHPKRIRYLLQRKGTTWRITGLEWDCGICDGSGKRLDKVCQHCLGTGWRDVLKNDAVADTALEPPPTTPAIPLSRLARFFRRG